MGNMSSDARKIKSIVKHLNHNYFIHPKLEVQYCNFASPFVFAADRYILIQPWGYDIEARVNKKILLFADSNHDPKIYSDRIVRELAELAKRKGKEK
jgi:hypothetical protein